jgi:hypothetical protein
MKTKHSHYNKLEVDSDLTSEVPQPRDLLTVPRPASSPSRPTPIEPYNPTQKASFEIGPGAFSSLITAVNKGDNDAQQLLPCATALSAPGLELLTPPNNIQYTFPAEIITAQQRQIEALQQQVKDLQQIILGLQGNGLVLPPSNLTATPMQSQPIEPSLLTTSIRSNTREQSSTTTTELSVNTISSLGENPSKVSSVSTTITNVVPTGVQLVEPHIEPAKTEEVNGGLLTSEALEAAIIKEKAEQSDSDFDSQELDYGSFSAHEQTSIITRNRTHDEQSLLETEVRANSFLIFATSSII